LAVVVAGTVALALFAARRIQDHRMEALLTTLLDAPRSAVPVSAPEPGVLKIPLATESGDPMQTAYLDLHLDAARCSAGFLLGLRYASANPLYDFTAPVRVRPAGTRPARVLVPVYRDFDGVTITGAPHACVTRIEQVQLGPDTPLLPVLTLPSDWRQRPKHHTLELSSWGPPFRWIAPERAGAE
jgi:hypothetical protein